MAFNFTDEQRLAINASAGTLVSAAAGSGKTAVLAERVVRLLAGDNPISADRILVCTFMSAAAEEMRSRIEKRLGEEYLASPDNRRLYEQRLKIKNAKICTIDSFCIELIRENFDALGIAPDFSIGDDISVSKIKEQALGSVLNEEFSNNSPEFVALLNALCSRFDETDLKDAIVSVYNYSQNLPFPCEWLESLQKRTETDEYIAEIIGAAYSELEKHATSAKNRLKSTIEKLAKDEQLYSALAPVLLSDAELFDRILNLINERDWNELLLKISTVSFTRWPTIRNCESPLKDAAKQIREASKEDFSKIKDIVYAPECEIISDIKASLSLVKKLISLVIGFTDKFDELCAKENVVTFAQAEHFALNLLCEMRDGDVVLRESGAEIVNRFDEVLVDEFQDINDMQDLLFGILSKREANLFAVGDVKQSIYGFRGSNPNNFLKKKNAYPLMEEQNQTGLKKVILASNFRSRSGICDFVNYLFSILMNGDKSKVKYSEEETLKSAATYPETNGPAAEMHFIDIDANELSATEYEAEYIAQYIKEIIENGQITEGTDDNRPLRRPSFGDFAILLRAVKSKGAIYMKALEKNGIPVNFSAESPFDASEVKIALALLTVIANPSRDIELVSVLMSPIFGFSADELAKIRADSRKTTFIAALSNAASNGNTKAAEFLKKLNIYRTASVTMGIGDLLDYLYEETELLNIVSALENGEERRANLENLYIAAIEFQNAQPTKNALLFVDFIRKRSGDAVAETVSGKENAVKILTVHKSKGLQYPICILADTQKRFSGEDSRKNLLLDSEKGIGFRYFEISENAKKESLHYKLIKAKNLETSYEEELRLAYVAATRAKEKLVIVNSARKMSEVFTNAAALSLMCDNIDDLRAIAEKSGSYFGWYLAAAVSHPDFRLCEIRERYIVDTESKALFNFVSASEIEKKTEVIDDNTIAAPDKELADKMRQNISFIYPYESVKNIETKGAAAKLTHAADSKNYSFTSKPDFMSASGLSPAKRGTATHRFMQFADFTTAETSVIAELDRLYEWEFISLAEHDAVDTAAVERFFESDIYKRIKNSLMFEREKRFITEMPAGRFDKTLQKDVADEPIIIQGSVDLVFEEADGLVILDFKTDRTTNSEQLIEAYSEQLNIYAAACEKIYRKPVKQLLLYAFSKNGTVEIPKKDM